MSNKVITKGKLSEILKRLNIESGDIIFVQTLAHDNEFLGGAEMLVDLLLELVGEEGTVVVPLSGYNNEPAYVLNQRNNDIQLDEFRNNMPPYTERTMSTYAKDYLALNMMMREGVCISSHHSYPFAALGVHAEAICNSQDLDFPLGSNSPMARLYELRAKVLLINVGLVDVLSNKYAYQIAEKTAIRINGGIVKNNDKSWLKYFEYEDYDKLTKKIVSEARYKSLFKQVEYENNYYIAAQIHHVIDEFVDQLGK